MHVYFYNNIIGLYGIDVKKINTYGNDILQHAKCRELDFLVFGVKKNSIGPIGSCCDQYEFC